MGLDAIAKESSPSEASRLQEAMFATVDEVGRVVAAEEIDCHWQKGGYINVSRSRMQLDRAKAEVEHLRSYGFGADDYRLLDQAEARAICNATDAVGGVFTPHCAAIHPARLARGLARVIERRGATIFEHSPVTRIEPGVAHTALGVVRARHVVRATEAFTGSIAGNVADQGTIAFARSMTFTGVVSGSGNLAVASGTLKLTSDQTYTGFTQISSGATLQQIGRASCRERE